MMLIMDVFTKYGKFHCGCDELVVTVGQKLKKFIENMKISIKKYLNLCNIYIYKSIKITCNPTVILDTDFRSKS